jgi:hypothetical protein
MPSVHVHQAITAIQSLNANKVSYVPVGKIFILGSYEIVLNYLEKEVPSLCPYILLIVLSCSIVRSKS